MLINPDMYGIAKGDAEFTRAVDEFVAEGRLAARSRTHICTYIYEPLCATLAAVRVRVRACVRVLVRVRVYA